MKHLLMCGFAMLLLFCASGARAESCSTSIQNVDFAAADLLANQTINTTATISVACQAMGTQTIRVCPSLGAGSGGVASGWRRMSGSGGAVLLYNLYQDSARTLPWGSASDPSLGTVPIFVMTGAGAATTTATFTLYATLAAAQTTQPPGSYQSNFTAAFTHFIYAKGGSCQGSAFGPPDNPTFSVLAAPTSNCRLSASDLGFGSWGVLDANVDAATSMSVTCTNTTPYAVELGNGLNGTAPTDRRMKRGAETVTYGLYRNSGRTLPWGVAALGQAESGTGSGQAQTFQIYGRAPPQNTPSAGAYTDAIVATVEY